MKFCPFRSTSEKEVECNKNCALYSGTDDDSICQINYIASKLQTLDSELDTATQSLEFIGSALANKCF